MIDSTDQREHDINTMNGFLRGERAAAETYQQAIDATSDEALKVELIALKASHTGRIPKLESQVKLLGGDPDESSGAWGTFARTVEAGASMLSDSPAIKVLEKGEEYGLEQYKDALGALGPMSTNFVQTELLPRQRLTLRRLNEIQEQVWS